MIKKYVSHLTYCILYIGTKNSFKYSNEDIYCYKIARQHIYEQKKMNETKELGSDLTTLKEMKSFHGRRQICYVNFF